MNLTARFAVAAACLALAACATAPPVLTPSAVPVAAMPYEVAATPERYSDDTVLWGGMILAVSNLADSTEVTILGYPLDRAQRPVPRAATQGRFILVLPGYVERHDYPDGLFLTATGALAGTRVGRVDEADYVYPLVRAEHVHRWPSGYQFDQPTWRVGIGVGVGIR